MNATKSYNLSMVRGDTLAFAFEIDGVASLDSAYFTVKANVQDDNYILQKSLNSGITVVETGKWRVRVAPEDTANIEVGSYYYDLEIGVNSDIYTIITGKLKVQQDITRSIGV